MADKVAKSGFTAVKSEFVDAPVMAELPLVLECELVSMNEENCNVVGRILNCAVEESALTDGKPDAAKAVEWYRKAADQGHPGAQTFLGFALLTGSGVAKAPEQAVAWFRKAAEKGNPEAQQNLGRCLFNGDGCEKNEQEAVSWYRKAAEQGESGAMFNLGACYLEGTGVKKDRAEATKWFKRAASLGHKRSAEVLEKLQKDSAWTYLANPTHRFFKVTVELP